MRRAVVLVLIVAVYTTLNADAGSSSQFKGLRTRAKTLASFNKKISVLGRNRMAREAVETFEELKDVTSPDVYCYTSLINALARVGRADDACVYFQKMKEEGLAPTNATYGALIKAYCAAGDVRGGILLLDELRATRCSPLSAYALAVRFLELTNFRCDQSVHREQQSDRHCAAVPIPSPHALVT